MKKEAEIWIKKLEKNIINLYREDDLCSCGYCKNYRKLIGKTYKELGDYLEEMGVDIEKYFETMPLEPEGFFISYQAVQYIVMGTRDDFKEKSLGELSIYLFETYPDTEIKEEHFVIEISPIRLKWLEK